MPRSAYVHIPFCRRRCYYCDFPVAIVGDRPPVGTEFATIAHYVDLLCREIAHGESVSEAVTLRSSVPLETIFFGGGTPSLLSVAQLQQILQQLDDQFGIAEGAEISMEMDPGTFDRAKAAGFYQAGINRVSLGAQAFQPQLLKLAGRAHVVEDIATSVHLLRHVGFTNISLDLISGLPTQTIADWTDSLEQAIALQPTHISCYDLTIEPMTAFGKQYQPGMAPLPSDETTATFYRTAQQRLTAAGLDHYEISNYAKPEYHCRHNRVYWEYQPFYGFGMGATSFVAGQRVARPRKTRDYETWVMDLVNETRDRPQPDPQTATDELLEVLMVGLRLAEGVEIERLIQQFGATAIAPIWPVLRRYAASGWVTLPAIAGDSSLSPTIGHIRLNDPEGFLFSNVVLSALFDTLSNE